MAETNKKLNNDENKEGILYEENEGVATITINRPDAKNSLNEEAIDKFVGLLQRIGDSPEIKVAIIKSTGERVFCAGLDLKWLKSLGEQALSVIDEKATKLTKALMNCPKIIISQVQGPAVGWGTMIFLNTDFRIVADSDDVFFQLPEVDVGYPAISGAALLPVMHLGLEKAKRMLILREKVKIDFMKEIIIKTVPKENLDEETLTFAKSLANHPNSQLINLTNISINAMGKVVAEKLFDIEKEVIKHVNENEQIDPAKFSRNIWKTLNDSH